MKDAWGVLEGTWRVDPEIVLPGGTLAGTRRIQEGKGTEDTLVMRAQEKEAFAGVRDAGTRVMMIGCDLVRVSTPATTTTQCIYCCGNSVLLNRVDTFLLVV